MTGSDDDTDRTAENAPDMWARRRGKNIAIFSTIMALAVLFFVITILRMS